MWLLNKGIVLSEKCILTALTFVYGITGTLENSEDTDEMPYYAAFHQGLHCLLIQKQS